MNAFDISDCQLYQVVFLGLVLRKSLLIVQA
jgi:hypothetical protein